MEEPGSCDKKGRPHITPGEGGVLHKLLMAFGSDLSRITATCCVTTRGAAKTSGGQSEGGGLAGLENGTVIKHTWQR